MLSSSSSHSTYWFFPSVRSFPLQHSTLPPSPYNHLIPTSLKGRLLSFSPHFQKHLTTKEHYVLNMNTTIGMFKSLVGQCGAYNYIILLVIHHLLAMPLERPAWKWKGKMPSWRLIFNLFATYLPPIVLGPFAWVGAPPKAGIIGFWVTLPTWRHGN